MRNSYIHAVPACVVSVLLSACGGGGSDSAPAATTTTTTPVAVTTSASSSSGAVGAFTSNGVTYAVAPAATTTSSGVGSASLITFPNTGAMVGAASVAQISKTVIQTSLKTSSGSAAAVSGTSVDPTNDLGMAFNYYISKISIFKLSTATEISTYDSAVTTGANYSGGSGIVTVGAVMDSALKSIILATGGGFQVIDYSTPASPVLKKTIPSLLADPVNGVEVMENFGYDNLLASGPLILTGGKESGTGGGPFPLVLVSPTSGKVYRPDTATAAYFVTSQYIDSIAVDTVYHVAVLADEGMGTTFVDLNQLTLNAAAGTYTLPQAAVSRITTYTKMDNLGVESNTHLMMMGQGYGGYQVVVAKLKDPKTGLGFAQEKLFTMPAGTDNLSNSYSFSGGYDPHTSGAYRDANGVARGLWVDGSGGHIAVINLANVLAGYTGTSSSTYNPLSPTPKDIAYFAVP